MQTITCDQCRQPITITPHEDPHPTGDGIIQSFDCPHCHHHYPIAHITALGVRLRNELQQLRRLARQHTTPRLQSRLDTKLQTYRTQVHDLTTKSP